MILAPEAPWIEVYPFPLSEPQPAPRLWSWLRRLQTLHGPDTLTLISPKAPPSDWRDPLKGWPRPGADATLADVATLASRAAAVNPALVWVLAGRSSEGMGLLLTEVLREQLPDTPLLLLSLAPEPWRPVMLKLDAATQILQNPQPEEVLAALTSVGVTPSGSLDPPLGDLAELKEALVAGPEFLPADPSLDGPLPIRLPRRAKLVERYGDLPTAWRALRDFARSAAEHGSSVRWLLPLTRPWDTATTPITEGLDPVEWAEIGALEARPPLVSQWRKVNPDQFPGHVYHGCPVTKLGPVFPAEAAWERQRRDAEWLIRALRLLPIQHASPVYLIPTGGDAGPRAERALKAAQSLGLTATALVASERAQPSGQALPVPGEWRSGLLLAKALRRQQLGRPLWLWLEGPDTISEVRRFLPFLVRLGVRPLRFARGQWRSAGWGYLLWRVVRSGLMKTLAEVLLAALPVFMDRLNRYLRKEAIRSE